MFTENSRNQLALFFTLILNMLTVKQRTNEKKSVKKKKKKKKRIFPQSNDNYKQVRFGVK